MPASSIVIWIEKSALAGGIMNHQVELFIHWSLCWSRRHWLISTFWDVLPLPYYTRGLFALDNYDMISIIHDKHLDNKNGPK